MLRKNDLFVDRINLLGCDGWLRFLSLTTKGTCTTLLLLLLISLSLSLSHTSLYWINFHLNAAKGLAKGNLFLFAEAC